MPNFNNLAPYPDEDTMNAIRRYLTGAGAGALGAAGTVASMNPFGGLLALAGAAYPRRAEAPMETSGLPLTNEQMWRISRPDLPIPPIIIEAQSDRPSLVKKRKKKKKVAKTVPKVGPY